jgi:hypothetical protein
LIPSLAVLGHWCRFLARRYEWELSPHDVRLLESLRMAREVTIALAASPEDEPAALFFAFSRDYAFLGEDLLALPTTLARNNARSQGLELRASRFELVEQARAVSAGIVNFEALRAWFAARLVPLGR